MGASKFIKEFFNKVWWKLYEYWEKWYIRNEEEYGRTGLWKNKRPDMTFYVIRRRGDSAGLFSYVLVILEKIAYCDDRNYAPVIDMQYTRNTYLDKMEVGFVNSWEYYFKQPAGYGLKNISRCKNVIFSDMHIKCLVGSKCFQDPAELKKWSDLYKKYIVLNEKTKEHIGTVKKQLFSESDKVLGVLCRGTDYNNHPSKHPIQPEPHQVINDAQQILTGGGYDKLFLVTEDAEIYKLFQERFGKKMVAVNQIRYVGKEEITTRNNVRKRDKYLQGLDYITAIYLLAGCEGILAGYTNGALAAVLINAGAYEFSQIYSLGFYP